MKRRTIRWAGIAAIAATLAILSGCEDFDRVHWVDTSPYIVPTDRGLLQPENTDHTGCFSWLR